MSSTIGGVRIVDMPDLGAVTDDSSVVGEHAGSGRFNATALRSYAGAGGNIGRNLLHNSMFIIKQRGIGPFAAFSGYTLDRWQLRGGLDSASITQADTATAGIAAIGDEVAYYALSNNFAGNASAAAWHAIVQMIEGVRRLSGKTVTISFWAISSGAPRLGVSLDQVFGGGGSATVVGTGQAVTLSTTWTRYSLTFTLPSAGGKTIGTNDATALNIWFSSGATNASRAGNIGVQSSVVNLWGVQLEVGSAATALEKPDPCYDLGNAQRFYYVGQFVTGAHMTGGEAIVASYSMPASMRALPTLIILDSSFSANITGPTISAINPTDLYVTGTCFTTGDAILNIKFSASADL